MNRLLVSAGLVLLCSAITAQSVAQTKVWHRRIDETIINVRGAPVVVGQLNVWIPDSGHVLVQFNGLCIADSGDGIRLAASNTPNWGVDDGGVSVKSATADDNQRSFSHTRMYPVSAGNHTFYAVVENFPEKSGRGIASIYASLTVKFFPEGAASPFVRHQGIKMTNIDVRGAPVVVGEIHIDVPHSGHAVVRFDGYCYSDVGDRIALAASKIEDWLGNDGAVSVKATDASNRRTPFSHTRVYPIAAGYHIYFAVAENIGGYIGSGIASIYASLSVEYFPDIVGQAFVKHQGIAEYNINVRGNPVVVGQVNITAPLPGQVWVQFDGHCYSDVGDRIALAASSSPDFRGGGNDGIVLVEATNSDLRNDSFSHSRVYLVPAGSHDLYAVAENYVETAGNGEASIYASLTVEFFPGSMSDILPSGELPTEYALSQNYPNPFNPGTTIDVALPHAGYVTLRVYNVLGEEVAALIEGDHAAGTFKATWDASGLPSGVYFYRLTAGEYVQTREMILMK